MTRRTNFLLAGGVAAVAGAAALLLPGQSAITADHLDPPSRTDPAQDSTPDRAADIADVYAWAEGGNMNIAVTFAGPAPVSQAATYDRDVLYRVFISNDGDPLSTENVVEVRFGPGSGNTFGVRASGIPGAGTISGPVETDLTSGGTTLRAGLFDDPFFFDLQGFQQTRDTGTLSFDPNRDFFAGSNVTAFVMQIPLADINPTGAVTVWADTSRFGGQL
jgi:hypothetical protein